MTTTTTTTSQTRAAALKAAREKDSQDKRRRALEAIAALETAGTPITFPGVAKAAGVSTWLIYSEGIRQHVQAARRRQSEHGPVGSSVPDKQRATPASLRTDLSIAREQIRQLRTERDKLRGRLRLHLGAEIDGPDRAQLITRVAELEAANRQIVTERDARAAEADHARHHIDELQDELAAVRESLRRVIRAENRGQ